MAASLRTTWPSPLEPAAGEGTVPVTHRVAVCSTNVNHSIQQHLLLSCSRKSSIFIPFLFIKVNNISLYKLIGVSLCYFRTCRSLAMISSLTCPLYLASGRYWSHPPQGLPSSCLILRVNRTHISHFHIHQMQTNSDFID